MPQTADPPKADSKVLLSELSKRLTQKPPEVQQRIMAHVRAVTGHNTIAHYVNNGAEESEKVAVLSACIRAVLKGDYSELKGQVPQGQAKAENSPQDAPEPGTTSKPAPPAKRPPAKAVAPAATGIVSFKVMVLAVGETKAVSNGLRFETALDANRWGEGLMDRWTGAKSFTVEGDQSPVNVDANGKLLTTPDPTPPAPKADVIVDNPPPGGWKPEDKVPDEQRTPYIEGQTAGKASAHRQPPGNYTPAAMKLWLAGYDNALAAELAKGPPPEPAVDPVATAMAALKAALQPAAQAPPAIDKAALTLLVTELVEAEVKKRIAAVQAQTETWLKLRIVEAKYELLGVMQKAYDKHKSALAEAIEGAE